MCNTSTGASGYVSLEMTSNGRDFSLSGVFFLRVSLVVVSVSPWLGPFLGGTLISFTASGTPFSNMSCLFAGGARVPAWPDSSRSFGCVAPPRSVTGWVDVTFSSFFAHLAFTSSFLYVDPLLNFGSTSGVLAVIPSSGPSLGGTVVTLSVSRAVETSDVLCRFGERGYEVLARSLNAYALECISPGHQPAIVSLEVSLNGQQFSTDGERLFEFVDATKIHSISPSRGPVRGSHIVYLTGQYFPTSPSQTTACKIHTTISPATFVTSEQVKCSIPAFTHAGYYPVEVTTNLQDFTASGIQFLMYVATVRSVEPSHVFQSGGTEILVTGINFSPSPVEHLWCFFGTNGPVAAIWE